MPYVFSSNGIQGACFRFLENGDEKRERTFLTKRNGKVVQGTLALQVFNDRNYKRLTFADSGNVYTAFAKQLFGYFQIANAVNVLKKLQKGASMMTENELVHFDFCQEDFDSGKKLMRFECMLSVFGATALMCYDFTSYTGCSYLFPDFETAKQWAKALEINYYYSYGLDDEFLDLTDF